MLTFTDEDIVDCTLMKPWVGSFQQDFTAVVLEVGSCGHVEPMLFLTKEDLQNLLALFDKEETN
jgi:hypothetical protein